MDKLNLMSPMDRDFPPRRYRYYKLYYHMEVNKLHSLHRLRKTLEFHEKRANSSKIHILFSLRDFENRTILHWSAIHHSTEMLNLACEIFDRNHDYFRPLFWQEATARRETPFLLACRHCPRLPVEENFVFIHRLSGDHSASIHNQHGFNALHIAAETNNPLLIQHLSEVYQMPLTARTDERRGDTPAHVAARRDNADALWMLIRLGRFDFVMRKRNRLGETVGSIARKNYVPNVWRLLEDYRALGMEGMVQKRQAGAGSRLERMAASVQRWWRRVDWGIGSDRGPTASASQSYQGRGNRGGRG